MKPGDVVRCSTCGTEATAYTTGDPARWRSGYALMISWHGYRHEAAVEAPDRCLSCVDGTAPRAPPTRRIAILDNLAVLGCRVSGAEWNTDELLELAYQRWIRAGAPGCSLVEVGEAPAVDVNACPPFGTADETILVETDRGVMRGEIVRMKLKPKPAQGSLF